MTVFERFTTVARHVVLAARLEAIYLNHREILAEDLMLGVLRDPQVPAARVLLACGVDRQRLSDQVASLGQGDANALWGIGIDLDSVRQQIEEEFGAGALGGSGVTAPNLRLSEASKRALSDALHQAVRLGNRFIAPEHIVLGLLSSDHTPTAVTLTELRVELDHVRSQIGEQLRRAA